MRDKKTGRFLSKTDRKIINNFSIINKESSYWLGFLFGDGSIDKKGKLQVGLAPNKENLEHLQKLSNFIFNKDYTKTFKTVHHLQITDHELAFNLNKYGIIPNKTYLSNMIIPPDYKFDFIRGFFDADGWCSCGWSKNKKYNIFYKNKNVGFCSYLKSNMTIIQNTLDIDGGHLSKKTNQHLYELRYHRHTSILEFYNKLYPDAILFLNRKRDKILESLDKSIISKSG